MSHILKTGTSILKNGDNIFRVNDKLNVLVENKGGFGSVIEGLRIDPIISNHRVAISGAGFAKIVDTDTFNVIATVSIPGMVVGFAWDSPNNKLYATAGGYLYIINTTTWTAAATALVGGIYTGIAIDPNSANNRLIIGGGGKLNFVNRTSFAITHVMTSGFTGIYGIAFHPDIPNRIYVGNYASNYISVVDTDNFIIVDTITGFSSPIDLSFDPNPTNNRFIVSEYAGGQVAYVDKGTHGILKRVSAITGPEGIAFDPNIVNNRFIVASASLGQYAVVREILT
ncbi:YncE family protein [Mucilaginibacter myungsuensis]|uniref:Uncharacterized protein n=1 Tax=Mucilaginibacter myungsuensis TaxID=649104 RepID=A0A929PVQ7_9SPHI|nr:hypothetical protein [Mucilaginibacter myungsuensis]MBE9662028.1 hypothetical protein [Mucilaginibacter myungsuensis]MDN3599539.1 hypothetical protein [Mucilaginibacter myungsuensis]